MVCYEGRTHGSEVLGVFLLAVLERVVESLGSRGFLVVLLKVAENVLCRDDTYQEGICSPFEGVLS